MKRITFFKSGYRWYFPAFIIVVILFGVATSLFLYHKNLEESKKTLLQRGNTISKLINAKEVQLLTGNNLDLETEAYKNLKESLTKARKESGDVKFFYLMAKRDNKTIFLLDSENPLSQDYSAPGDIYEEPSGAIESAFNGVGAVEGPVSDSFGVWFSAISPIENDQGQIIAIFGIDVVADHYINQAWTIATVPIMIAFFLVLFALAGLFLRKKENEQIETRSQFVAVASHEIRTPLTGIIWALKTINKTELSEDNKKLTEEISSSVHNLIDTVNDILAIAGIDSDQGEKIEISVIDLIKQSIKQVELLIQNKSIDIVLDEGQFSGFIIKADQEKVKNMFTNIISNSIKYSPEHSKIRIACETISTKRKVIFSDEGVGIPKKEQTRILDGFYRASNVKKKFSGSGLGLYFANRVMNLHGGKLLVDSEENKGTKITLEFNH